MIFRCIFGAEYAERNRKPKSGIFLHNEELADTEAFQFIHFPDRFTTAFPRRHEYPPAGSLLDPVRRGAHAGRQGVEQGLRWGNACGAECAPFQAGD